MKKLLLVVLAWMVLAGASRAQDGRIAGDGPAEVMVPEPGMVTLAVRNAHAAAYRLAGQLLGNFITDGMSRQQVRRILGKPDVEDLAIDTYKNLGIHACYGSVRNAAGDRRLNVVLVHFLPFSE